MHRRLPKDLNLHLLSFLSIDDALKTKTVNQASHKIINDPGFWRLRLKKDLAVSDSKEIEHPQKEYKKLYLQEKAEKELYFKLIEAHIFSLEIKRYEIEHKRDCDSATFDHIMRLEQFDKALLRSDLLFEDEYKKMKNTYSEIELKNVNTILDDIKRDNAKKLQSWLLSLHEVDGILFSQSMVFSYSKADAWITLRIFLDQRKFVLEKCLGDLLHIACSFLRVKTAEFLIEQGSNTNYFMENRFAFGVFSLTTPLFEVIQAMHSKRIHQPTENIEPAKHLIHLLLKNGADPHARIYSNDGEEPLPDFKSEAFEKQKRSIYEICLELRENYKQKDFVELFDIIIEAANKKQAEHYKTIR